MPRKWYSPQSDAAWSLYIRIKYGAETWKALFG